jgi:hypothetical protein
MQIVEQKRVVGNPLSFFLETKKIKSLCVNPIDDNLPVKFPVERCPWPRVRAGSAAIDVRLPFR